MKARLRVDQEAMGKPRRRDLLPGVSDAGEPTAVLVDARTTVTRARCRAAARDVVDLLLLGCVDGLFLRYPNTHVPLLTRAATLGLLLLVHAAFIASVWAARAFPRWRARRVASTWCIAERRRFRPASSSARG
jgi:hypothetical protein